jgi:glutaredoxin
MKQQCHISFVYGSWLILAAGFFIYIFMGNIVQAVLWAGFVALFLWLYIRYFPSFAHSMGYGSVADEPARDIRHSSGKVYFYTGLGCPFCPIVRRRLIDLKGSMGFELIETDVTLKPELVIAKGIRALPVVEIGGVQWVGNATSQQLSEFIANNAHSIQAA